MCVCVCRFVCLYVCVHGSACVCVCMCCFREENCGQSAANAQSVGDVETAPPGVKSAAVDTAVKEDATDEIANEIADKTQVVCFFLCCIAVFTATLRQCNSQTVQLRCSPPLSERFFFVVMQTPLRRLPPRSM